MQFKNKFMATTSCVMWKLQDAEIPRPSMLQGGQTQKRSAAEPGQLGDRFCVDKRQSLRL